MNRSPTGKRLKPALTAPISDGKGRRIVTIDNCQRHGYELSVDECRECRRGHCAECLVYVEGPKSRPLCIPCALAISGIRRSGRARRMSWREKREQRRRDRHQAKLDRLTVSDD